MRREKRTEDTFVCMRRERRGKGDVCVRRGKRDMWK